MARKHDGSASGIRRRDTEADRRQAEADLADLFEGDEFEATEGEGGRNGLDEPETADSEDGSRRTLRDAGMAGVAIIAGGSAVLALIVWVLIAWTT